MSTRRYQKIRKGRGVMKYHYNHDMMHCSQKQCPKRKTCWRYQLGLDMMGHGYTLASFYFPSINEDLSNCEYYIDKRQYKIVPDHLTACIS